MLKGGLRQTQPQKSHCYFIKGSSWGAGSPEEAKPECGIAAGSHRHAMGDGMEQKHTVMHGDGSLLGWEASEHSWGSLNSGQLGERASPQSQRTKDWRHRASRPCGTQRNFNQGGDSCAKLWQGTALTANLVSQPLSNVHLASVCLLEDRLTKTMMAILYFTDIPANWACFLVCCSMCLVLNFPKPPTITLHLNIKWEIAESSSLSFTVLINVITSHKILSGTWIVFLCSVFMVYMLLTC